MDIKASILRTLRSIGMFTLGRRLTKEAIMFVGWHGVSRHDEHQHFPSLYISPESFRQRLKWLTSNYSVVSLDDAVRQLQSGNVAERQVVLTFDDGNYDFFAEAMPTLEEFGVTATNYVVTYFSETGEPVWNMLVRYLVSIAARNAGNSQSERLRNERQWLARLARLEGTESKQLFVQEMVDELHVDPSFIFSKRIMHTMRPAEIREAEDRGFQMEMHTHEHKNVVDNFQDLDSQITQCRDRLKLWTQKDNFHFCYPSGRWHPAAVEKLQALGVTSAITTRPGPNLKGTNLLSLRRVLNGEVNSQLEFEFEMTNLRWIVNSTLDRRYRFNPPPQRMNYKDEKSIKRLGGG